MPRVRLAIGGTMRALVGAGLVIASLAAGEIASAQSLASVRPRDDLDYAPTARADDADAGDLLDTLALDGQVEFRKDDQLVAPSVTLSKTTDIATELDTLLADFRVIVNFRTPPTTNTIDKLVDLTKLNGSSLSLEAGGNAQWRPTRAVQVLWRAGARINGQLADANTGTEAAPMVTDAKFGTVEGDTSLGVILARAILLAGTGGYAKVFSGPDVVDEAFEAEPWKLTLSATVRVAPKLYLTAAYNPIGDGEFSFGFAMSLYPFERHAKATPADLERETIDETRTTDERTTDAPPADRRTDAPPTAAPPAGPAAADPPATGPGT